MKKYLLSLVLFLSCAGGYCTTWTVTNTGYAFSPATITITIGDDVNFVLASIHNVQEVSQTTWAANDNTPLSGGFSTSFGGGLVPSSQLGIGTHYYVCVPHASMPMKGMIIVQSVTGIAENQLQPGFSVFPNPTDQLLTIKANSALIGSEYFITDRSGRQVLSGSLVNESTPVNMGQLTSGIYLFQIKGQKGQLVKVIKN
jgi:plastocyanin